MTARAVIGASFGDEGKGLVTDYLCATQGAGMVVRYNGGAQAGHTVVTPDGDRHVFSHFGSGTLWGTPTFLSQFFTVNPILFFKERDALLKLGVNPQIYAHPQCLVTTFADMIINQRLEEKRGAARHGSVGVGFNETYERSQISNLKITMADIWNGQKLTAKLTEICTRYAAFRSGSEILDAEPMIAAFEKGCAMLADLLHPLGIGQCKDIVFEGAQGLLLSQDNKEFFPHLTRSHTGMHNIRILCEQAGIKKIEPYYVSRTYLTRHGAGPLPGHDPRMSYPDDTNVPHDYQGVLRFAPLDTSALLRRIEADCQGLDYKLVMTHCDQLEATIPSHLKAYGPTRIDVERT